jgi:predicted transcriptional regulator
LDSLEVIERVAGKIAPGPSPSFNEAHVVKTLETISSYGNVGRVSLSKVLKLGIGTTRTILKHLKKEGLIEGSKYGFVFSERGKKLFSDLRLIISEGVEVPNSPLTVGPVVIAVLVKDAARKVRRGAEQRNTAIRAGGRGATTLIFSDKKLIMASKKDHSLEDILPIHDILLSKMNPEEDGVILLGSGVDRTSAEIGAIMAAIKLLKAEEVD